MYILDSSVVLAYILGEAGSQEAKQYLANPVAMSWINITEVLIKLHHYGKSIDLIKLIDQTGTRRLPYSGAEVQKAEELIKQGVKGLSLGDRVCIATAQSFKCPVVTADRLWAELDLPVEVKLIR